MEPSVIRAVTFLLVAVVIGGYIAFVIWRVRVDRLRKEAKAAVEQGLPMPVAPPRRRRFRRDDSQAAAPAPMPKLSKAERKAAAIAGTTPVNRPDLADLHQRVIANAARLTGQEPEPVEPMLPVAPVAPTEVVDPFATVVEPPPVAPPVATPSVFTPTAAPAPATGESLFVPRSHGVSTVAELLAGIRLPADLAPLTTLSPRTGAGDRVAFFTVGPPAEVVAPALAAELERLGFAIQPQGYDTLIVTRGVDRAVVVVHPNGQEAEIEGVKGFPTVPEMAVVVEMWIPTV